jgi:hypothetical protein
MTDPGPYAHLFAGLPTDVAGLCTVVQGLMVHVFWAERYGLTLSDERKQEVQIRTVARKLERILQLDDSPLTTVRPLEKKLVGNCRDFSTMLTAMLRYQGIPARARCGFGMYFMPGHGEDHWVCEYWNAGAQRWVMVDPQLDEFQRKTLGIPFDTLDMPAGQFLPGGKAWLTCRAGQADPDSFGIFDMHGLWFIRGNVVRDLLALNKLEILPWDHWGLMSKDEQALTDAEWRSLDHMATVSQESNAAFGDMRDVYERTPDVRPPQGWTP